MNKFSAVLNRRGHFHVEGQSLKLGANFNPIIRSRRNGGRTGSGRGDSGVAGCCFPVVHTIDA